MTSRQTYSRDSEASSPLDSLLVERELQSRLHRVEQLAHTYYVGDLCAPSTKSQVLRAQKFDVLYFHIVNAVFFLYALFIPIFTKGPYYGGLNPRDFKPSAPQLCVMGILASLPMIRFVVLSWSAEYYQYGAVLAGLSAVAVISAGWFWSPGLPVLLVFFCSNFLVLTWSQLYWHASFVRVIQDIKKLVPPPSFHHTEDQTVLEVLPGANVLIEELRKLWGFREVNSMPQDLYDERCGVFGAKASMSHVEAMQQAYQQALNPWTNQVSWSRDADALWMLSPLGFLDGLLNTFVSNAAYAFAGLWLGKALFERWAHGELAVVVAFILIAIFWMSVTRTLELLDEGLGVAVVEKEWLAFDVVRHTGEREEMALHALDVGATSTAVPSPKVSRAELDLQLRNGRLNLTFLWLTVAALADFIGESFLARMYWNLSTESRYMVEALTPFDFMLFDHAKWEVTIKGTFIRSVHTLALTATTVLYFGTYFAHDAIPDVLMGVLGFACFVQSVVKVAEVMQYAITILGGRTTNRHTYVSESITGVVFISVLINILVWLYLVPIMKGWDLPAGGCSSWFNSHAFPGVCANRH